jgi:hypothetical protein
MQRLPRVAAKFADITVTATLANGNPATITGVSVAIVPPGSLPTASTVWVAANWASPVAQVLLIGPLCSPTSPPAYQLTVPSVGGDLWARVIDNPEVDAALVDHIELE